MISCIDPIICTTGCISCYIFPIYIPMLMAIFLNSPLFANFQLLVLCHHNLMDFWVSYFSEVQLENIHRFLLVSLPTFLPMQPHIPCSLLLLSINCPCWHLRPILRLMPMNFIPSHLLKDISPASLPLSLTMRFPSLLYHFC